MLGNKIYLLFLTKRVLTKRDFMTFFVNEKTLISLAWMLSRDGGTGITRVAFASPANIWQICYLTTFLSGRQILLMFVPPVLKTFRRHCCPAWYIRHGTHMNKEGNVMIRDWHSRTNSRHYTETPCTETKPSPPTKSQKRRNRENPKICNM